MDGDGIFIYSRVQVSEKNTVIFYFYLWQIVITFQSIYPDIKLTVKNPVIAPGTNCGLFVRYSRFMCQV
jgi:hypothetical protein